MNGIEKELAGKAHALRVNLLTQAGKKLATRFEVKSAGTIIVLNAAGTETYRRTGLPNRKEIVAATGVS